MLPGLGAGAGAGRPGLGAGTARPGASGAGAEPRTGPDRHDWYKDAVIYEVHVRAFHDSDGDGIGDFRGLTQKLDYLRDLGVTTIWLLPFYPSPLRDDGYDIALYKGIHPAYGTLRDFRAFMREARRQGLRVITELILNHSSDQHPWFQRARKARPGSSERDFYVWSDSPDRYRDARIIFKDFEASNWTWDRVAQAYFWHRFYSHQPDLNFDNADVRRAMFEVVDFWFGTGVDGLRLDAVPYLFEREGTNCENLPETLAYVEELRRHVDSRWRNRMLLAEANQWPEDAVAYFGQGDRCHMAFHFPLMPRMFMAIRMEDRFPVVDVLGQTPPIPDGAQWAIFLRNHDELTLEMVTDEERDYMYRVYAEDPQARINLGIRRRLAPLLGNDRRVIELMNGLLFSLPGTPVIYYGDEIGMGDNIYLGDRNGVRTPMQWSADRNAGFSNANPQRLYLPVVIDPEYSAAAINVEAQQNNPHSLLWWMKRLIALRKRYRAFGRGELEWLYPENRKVLAFLRRYEDERVLVVANLSRHAQYAELDLSEHRGTTPVELFGRTEFPRIGDLPYLLTLAPHTFYWFSLEPQRLEVQRPEALLPYVRIDGEWDEVLGDRYRHALEELLPSYIRSRRWFRSKSRRIKTAEVLDAVRVPREAGTGVAPQAGPDAFVIMVHLEFTEGDPETYVLPLTVIGPDYEGPEIPSHGRVARLRTRRGDMLLIDAGVDPMFGRAVLHAVSRRRTLGGAAGKVTAFATPAFRQVRGPADADLDPQPMQVEQTNTSVIYGDRLVLKLFRRLEDGVNPDVEIGRFLTERGFPHTPPLAGGLDYRRQGRACSLAILQGFVANEGDAWSYTLDTLASYLEEALARQPEERDPPLPRPARLLDLAASNPPDLASDLIGAYLESARLLGRRSAELHQALASSPDDPAFAPEPFSTLYQRSLYQSMRTQAQQLYRLLRARSGDIPQIVQVIDLEDEILRRLRGLLDHKVDAMRIRIHGDYHLGQVLYTGKDFTIIDFEGEPARPLGERRIKRSPLTDVAGMLRSFHYAAYTALSRHTEGREHEENPAYLEPWVLFWYRWVSAAFLQSYLDVAAEGSLLPGDPADVELLLDALMLEKALYELRYELNHRPGWVKVPIQGILEQVEPAT
jgi:maltose alpha-D-glucosyltransferase / alpha-amylase